MESYLTTFEQIEEREGLPEKEWVDVLTPFLSADPQQAYYDLSLEAVLVYKKVVGWE